MDRYWAISDPIQYARQRTIRRVLLMIMLVWILSATISVPPIIAQMLGSNELETYNLQQCELSRNKAYVIYSACGSFYIPALIMTIVYAHVFIETRKRFRERAKGLSTMHVFICESDEFSFRIAAAKLANVTQRSNRPCSPDTTKSNNNIKHKHHRRHHRKHLILHPGSSSFRSLASNGSVGDNFSTDEKEEEIMTSKNTSVNNHNQLIINNNQNSSSGKKKLVWGCSNLFLLVTSEASDLLANQNGSTSIQQQHASVQTSELLTKSSSRPSKDAGRRSLFKGKSLATLMNERQKISLTRERRLSRTLGIIISVFLLCWLPFFVVYILSAFIDISNYVIEPFPTLILWLGYINSACNPLIYTVFNVEFRMAFKRLLCPSSMNNSNNNTIHRYTTNRFSRT